jgi:large subunit ribosomal protein L20
MSRVTGGCASKWRHKRILKKASGYWGQRKNIFKRASETLLRAMSFEFKSRKLRKRDFRALFIKRIKISAEALGVKYSTLIKAAREAQVKLNRKILSQMSIVDPASFKEVVLLSTRASVLPI